MIMYVKYIGSPNHKLHIPPNKWNYILFFNYMAWFGFLKIYRVNLQYNAGTYENNYSAIILCKSVWA